MFLQARYYLRRDLDFHFSQTSNLSTREKAKASKSRTKFLLLTETCKRKIRGNTCSRTLCPVILRLRGSSLCSCRRRSGRWRSAKRGTINSIRRTTSATRKESSQKGWNQRGHKAARTSASLGRTCLRRRVTRWGTTSPTSQNSA